MSKILQGIQQQIGIEPIDEDLRKWFKEKWVRFGPDGKIRGDCARGSDSEGKPKCLPQAKAQALGKKGRKYAASKKRREDPNPERKGAAKNVATKKKTSESANPTQQSAIAIAMMQADKKSKYQKQDIAESIIFSDKTPKLSGLSFKEIDTLVESCGADYSKFHSAISKTLNVPEWTNTIELYGVYVRNLNNSDIITENKISNIEQKLFDEFSSRSTDSIADAKIGDKVSLLHLVTIDIPGHKVEARLGGFLNPKEIVEIVNKKGNIQLKFSDGVMYPDSGDASDIFQTAQSWNMTKLFSTYDAASKAYTWYALRGNQKSDELNLISSVYTRKEQIDELKCWSGYTRVQGVPAGAPGSCKKKTNEEHNEKCPHCGGELVSEELMNEKKDACYRKVKSRYKVWPSAYASGALVKCRKVGAKNWGTKSESAIMRGIPNNK